MLTGFRSGSVQSCRVDGSAFRSNGRTGGFECRHCLGLFGLYLGEVAAYPGRGAFYNLVQLQEEISQIIAIKE